MMPPAIMHPRSHWQRIAWHCYYGLTDVTQAEQAWLMAMAGYVYPEPVVTGLMRYLLHHIQPGSFLMAVLSNNLTEAILRGDEDSRAWLTKLVFFLVNYAPAEAWGSPDRVEAWLARRLTLTVDHPRSFPVIDGVTE